MLLTERDKEILQFINVFGKTYYEVLGKTFFSNDQIARNRITKLMKQKIISYISTGLESPRRALTLGSVGKDYIDVELGKYVKVPKISNTTIEHNILEQIVYYYLSQIGKVERTTIATHSKDLCHVPDMIYTTPKGMRIYIEVEITKKSKYRYIEIMRNIIKDKPDKLLYISDTADRAKSIVESIGYWGDKLTYIDIESFIKNITETQKISPHIHKDPNERPIKVITQQPKVVKIIEQEDKQLAIELINESTPFEKKDKNLEEIVVSNNVQEIHEHKGIAINEKQNSRNEHIYSVINNIINGLIYRVNTVMYAITLVLFYGGGSYVIWKIVKSVGNFL
jgi:hypothetical protein